MGIALNGMSSIIIGSTSGWIDPKIKLEQEKSNAPVIVDLKVYNKNTTKSSVYKLKRAKALNYNHTPGVWYKGAWETFHHLESDIIGFDGMLHRGDRGSDLHWYVPVISKDRILTDSEYRSAKDIVGLYNKKYRRDAWKHHKECVAEIKAALGL